MVPGYKRDRKDLNFSINNRVLQMILGSSVSLFIPLFTRSGTIGFLFIWKDKEAVDW
jgi:hypothetical protein